MKKKKDKLDEIDFTVHPRKMTKEDEQAISEYIRKQKEKAEKSKRKRAA